MFDPFPAALYLQGLADQRNRQSAAREQDRLASRKSLQALQLTDAQMERFQDRVRGVERRLADVLARKGKKGGRA